jgi:hypothetical protein
MCISKPGLAKKLAKAFDIPGNQVYENVLDIKSLKD